MPTAAANERVEALRGVFFAILDDAYAARQANKRARQAGRGIQDEDDQSGDILAIGALMGLVTEYPETERPPSWMQLHSSKGKEVRQKLAGRWTVNPSSDRTIRSREKDYPSLFFYVLSQHIKNLPAPPAPETPEGVPTPVEDHVPERPAREIVLRPPRPIVPVRGYDGSSNQALYQPTTHRKHARSSGRKKKVGRQRGRTVFIAATAAAALIAGIVIYETHSDKHAGSQASPSSSASGAHHSSKPSITQTTHTKPPSPGIPVGNFLSMSDVDAAVSSEDTSPSAVFPANAAVQTLPELFAQTQMPAEVPSESTLAYQEMKAGGYLLGGAFMYIDVLAKGAAPVTIHNVRIVNPKRLPIVTGKAFIIHQEGGANEGIQFMLDSPVPIGHVKSSGPDDGEIWQEARHSTVTATTKESFELHFAALKYAYSFNVAFDYEVGGKNYTQVLADDSGKPLTLRVSASLCPPPEFRKQLTPADLTRLGKLRYNPIRSNLMTGFYSVGGVTSDAVWLSASVSRRHRVGTP